MERLVQHIKLFFARFQSDDDAIFAVRAKKVGKCLKLQNLLSLIFHKYKNNESETKLLQ